MNGYRSAPTSGPTRRRRSPRRRSGSATGTAGALTTSSARSTTSTRLGGPPPPASSGAGSPSACRCPSTSNGPQFGWKRRVNPVHTMTSTGMDTAEQMGLPHGLSVADDVVFMPLQCATQWDGLGHCLRPRRGLERAGRPRGRHQRGRSGHRHRAPRRAGGRSGRAARRRPGAGEDGELSDGCPITSADLDETVRRQGPTSHVGRGDLVLVRTGQLTRVRRRLAAGEGWGSYAGGPAPGLSFETAGWLHSTEIAAVATDTWGVDAIAPSRSRRCAAWWRTGWVTPC